MSSETSLSDLIEVPDEDDEVIYRDEVIAVKVGYPVQSVGRTRIRVEGLK